METALPPARLRQTGTVPFKTTHRGWIIFPKLNASMVGDTDQCLSVAGVIRAMGAEDLCLPDVEEKNCEGCPSNNPPTVSGRIHADAGREKARHGKQNKGQQVSPIMTAVGQPLNVAFSATRSVPPCA